MSESTDDTINADRTLRGLHEGRRLAGRYELVRQLGEGGMGVVWLARDLAMRGDEVAIKALPEYVARDPDAIDQLIEEARVAIKLTHAGIMRLHNLDQSEPGLPFLVMEYLPGPTLKAVLRERRQAWASGPYLNDHEFQRFHAQVTEALDYAHGQKIIHRDLKPGNLMFDRPIDDPTAPIDFDAVQVKICDFGIARALEDCHTNHTGGPSPGTPRYMSPEQIRGKGIGPASDYYSLGCILYECLAGQPPFTTGDLTYQHLKEQPKDLPVGSEAFRALVREYLSKSPNRRAMRHEPPNFSQSGIELGPSSFDSDGDRQAAIVREAMKRIEGNLTEYVVPEASRGVTQLSLSGSIGKETWTIHTGREPRTAINRAAYQPDCLISMDIDDFANLAFGLVKFDSLLLQGRIDIKGDWEIGSQVFRLLIQSPSHQPSRTDVPAGRKDEPTPASLIFRKIEKKLVSDPSTRQRVGALIQFRLLGDDEDDVWAIDARNNPPRVIHQAEANADCKITIWLEDFLAIHRGEKTGEKSLMEGRMSIEGSLQVAIRIGFLFGG